MFQSLGFSLLGHIQNDLGQGGVFSLRFRVKLLVQCNVV